ncbi:MAG: hypothetical protein A3C93_03255 [Candidatus Lloydbacteria bacterium RIFCSPHIGHO2_02_FULL_54_17]|uniref:Uncharacterized protein n=1 Tax=Candidatus Lloydbacteria bacterium RIFCSPHIGHO2_02_FULL_54_17 TaxID=1798664 RepID=A0A1G2DF91_9BACT|nr:MAG: hypothetical protein A2762_04275 [Candidatus Lloydbacteria bacterium RIFCSPHIGHO2_01_FULL_54_11]OGZ12092.1 MAG: hypothetical protein A3C93_03255 [Candidatus Lloydbacteria bacterium RIFCSPHIGHO2_02_FULL_54_17]OGZ15737.1 MAG: hypothetical protein A3H76_06375 [Candidatus Lloydbacteria bacterium RIFCSPLOWO2_02_FULL_54_12]
MAKQGRGRRRANPVARALRKSGTPYGHRVERSKKEYRRTPKHGKRDKLDVVEDAVDIAGDVTGVTDDDIRDETAFTDAAADIAGDIGAIVVSTVLDALE